MSDGRLVRVKLKFERDYTQIPNEWLRDPKISLRARGLLALLMSHNEGYTVTHKSLSATNPEGYSAIQSAVDELKRAGYLAVTKERGRGGRISGWLWELTDPAELKKRWSAPHLDLPDLGYPDLAEPDMDNPRLKEAQSEEHLTKDLETLGSTRGGVNEDGLAADNLQSHDAHVETPEERYERLVHANCPFHQGSKHRYTGANGTCAWCGILPTQYWHGREIRYAAELLESAS